MTRQPRGTPPADTFLRRRILKLLPVLVSGSTFSVFSRSAELKRIPLPTYLPAGYRLATTWRDRPDGFNGGNDELAFFYVNPKYVQGMNMAMAVFVVPDTAEQIFFGTADHSGEPVALQEPDGSVVPAEYFDGQWHFAPNGERQTPQGPVHWDTINFHSIVFALGTYRIGIRACRFGAVNRQELITVASSFAVS